MNLFAENSSFDIESSGAFKPGGAFYLAGAANGPLARQRAAIKDIFDVAGYRTGAGNPDWLAEQVVATRHATAVEQLLAAGADLVGKTLTDELAYSLNGENHHYGTPLNPVTPRRIPGGSSAGSAVAVAAGLAEIGLGSDTAGSIRLPATFCGVWGFRPTHGVVSVAGAVPLAPSYDTVGWITPDAELLQRVGEVLLAPLGDAVAAAPAPRRLLIADDAWALAQGEVADSLQAALPKLQEGFAEVRHGVLAPDGFAAWQQVFRVIQGHEVWATHGAWITRRAPNFGPGVRERFQWAAGIDVAAADAARRERTLIAALLDAILQECYVCIPTVAFTAPLKGSPTSEADRTAALYLLSIASLGGLPQVAIPAARTEHGAVGYSVIGPRGSDRALLSIAAAMQ